MGDTADASNVLAIQRFYAAFGRRDHRVMAASYAPDASFRDPVFQELTGSRIGTMWRMLCERAADLRIECGPVRASGGSAACEWQAWYTYSATGRPVHNRIAAEFEFRDGLIVRHEDVFDLYQWARQALGLRGLLLGWSPPVRRAIQAGAARSLEAFERRAADAGRQSVDQAGRGGTL